MSDSTENFVLPTPRDRLNQVYERARELAELEQKISAMEREIERLQDDRKALSQKVLPDLFDYLQTDRLGVPGMSADVVLKNDIHANISKSWPREQQDAGFAELSRLKADDLMRYKVSVDFGRGEEEKAADFVRYISRWNHMPGHTIVTDRSVPWNTLTKFVREMLKKNVPVNLGVLGASATRACHIEWRRRDDNEY